MQLNVLLLLLLLLVNNKCVLIGGYTYLLCDLHRLLHGTESFLRSYPVLSYSRNSLHIMEPEGSLPHSQVPATCLYEPA